jgi:hypothetical protein
LCIPPAGGRGRSSIWGAAHSGAEVELLKAAARQRLAAGQDELDLGLGTAAAGGLLPITASRMGCLLDVLDHPYRMLGFDEACGGDEVFEQLVVVRIIEPVSKADSAWVLEEAGVVPASYPTVNRWLRVYAKDSWRERLSTACARHAELGPASLVLYHVSTLLCRPRHNSVYADLLVMPMRGVLSQVRAAGLFRKSAYS